MQNSEFEKTVQQKMEELKFAPDDAVWQKVEAALPKEKKRRWIIFLLLFAGLAAGSFLFINQYKKDGKKNIADNNITKKNDLQNLITPGKEKTVSDTVAALKNNPLNTVSHHNKKQNLNSSSFKIKIKQANANSFYNEQQEDVAPKNTIHTKTKSKINISIKNSVPALANEEEDIAKQPAEVVSSTAAINTAPPDTSSLSNQFLKNEIEVPITKIAEPAAITELKKDTSLVAPFNKSEKKKPSLKWEYGITAAAGIATVTTSLFSKDPVFFDANANAISAPPPNPQARMQPANPSKSGGYKFGVYAQKTISNKWKFNTGINYLYQSNNIKIGNRVDSSARYNYDVNKSIAANYFYKTGNIASYKNKFHLVEVPFLFQYKPLKKSSVYLETGPSLAYLVYSNALVYNSNASVYFTGKEVFNNLLFSFNFGAGINLSQKSRLPFSIGYHFNYGLGSVTKKPFGNQHLVNSLLYLKIPLKK